MTRTTTSLRLDDELRKKLARVAKRERTSLSALIERFVREGLLMEEHRGIVFNPTPDGGRVAVVSGAADVWEIISDLRRFEGPAEERISAQAEEMGWHKKRGEIALDYYAAHTEEIDDAIRENDGLWEAQEKLEAQRKQLFR